MGKGKMKKQLLEEGFDSGIRFDRIRISVHFPLLGLGFLLTSSRKSVTWPVSQQALRQADIRKLTALSPK